MTSLTLAHAEEPLLNQHEEDPDPAFLAVSGPAEDELLENEQVERMSSAVSRMRGYEQLDEKENHNASESLLQSFKESEAASGTYKKSKKRKHRKDVSKDRIQNTLKAYFPKLELKHRTNLQPIGATAGLPRPLRANSVKKTSSNVHTERIIFTGDANIPPHEGGERVIKRKNSVSTTHSRQTRDESAPEGFPPIQKNASP